MAGWQCSGVKCLKAQAIALSGTVLPCLAQFVRQVLLDLCCLGVAGGLAWWPGGGRACHPVMGRAGALEVLDAAGVLWALLN